MKRISWALSAILCTSSLLPADEGIWLFNQPPADLIERKYGFHVSDQFVDQLRLASVKISASGSFVSPRGLIFTNHHVASECIQQLSSAENDYMSNGFSAASEAEEKRCPGLIANVLVSFEDVTAKVNEGIAGDVPQAEANRRRKASTARIEKDCAASTGGRCDVVTLYSGGQYHLYRYKKYDDIRLVLAPEVGIAAFGGDPDNFTYPRYCLDVAFLRAYENGRPAGTEHYLPWSKQGVREGELVFVAGHPATTGRLNTVAQLEFFRDRSYPFIHARLASLIRALQAYSAQSDENRRVASDNLFSQQNSYKAYTGFLRGLRNRSLMEQKREEERRLRAEIRKDPKLRAEYGRVWEEVEAAYEGFRNDYRRYWLLETAATRGSELMRIARGVVRLAEERAKPNEQRLADYRESALPSLEASLYAAVPITASMEIAVLSDYFRFLGESLGAGDPLVLEILGGRTPEDAAGRYVGTTKLADVGERKRLAADAGAVRDSQDGMIRLARLIDPESRRLRKMYEDRVEAVLNSSAAKIAMARYRLHGASEYPDATSTLRLSFGPVKGYENDKGQYIPYATTFEGLYRRATGEAPFRLPERWLAAKQALDLTTPFNFVTTADTHGGNSGSPTVNTKGEVVGILFDGNLESLPGRFVYSDVQSRSVHVASQGIVEALKKVYLAGRVLEELGLAR
jgi:hypothetical protein